jgi:hypothetical protein
MSYCCPTEPEKKKEKKGQKLYFGYLGIIQSTTGGLQKDQS